MEHLDSLLKLVDSEFEAIEKNGKFRSRDEIDSVYKLVDIVKDIKCIHRWDDEDMYEYDMSYGAMPYGEMRYSENEGSYARGRRNANRDNMGRYSRNDYSRNSYQSDYGMVRPNRSYSRDDGKEEYKEQLMRLMEESPDEKSRQSIKRMLDDLR